MSSRTVAVVLKAQVDNYVAQMRLAEKHTTDVEKAARSATDQLRKHNESLTQVGMAAAAVGATAAVGLGIAIKASAEYGAKMAELRTLSGATVAEMNRLSDAAMKQGTAFGFTATQVADAQIELTKAGRDTAQILGGDLKGALALAAAGQMDVAQATQIGVTALTQFQRSGATIPQVADALSAGSAKALGSVTDLGMALQQGGLVASQMGLDLNDTVGTLSAFAQAGLIGSDAGTSFKTMLLSLQSPSATAQKLLDQYNITAYDSQGAFVGITNLAGQLKNNLKDLSQEQRDAALSTIFGTDAIRSANVLYTEGATGIQGWIDAVDDTGYASAQAAGKLNSLQGDLQKLSAAFETDLIKAGSSADGAFRGVVQSATGLVEMVGNIPQPVMAVGVAVTGLVAGVGLLGGAALIAVPKVVAFKAAMTELGISGKGTAAIFGKGAALSVGLSAVTAGLSGMARQGQATEQQIAQTGLVAKNSFKGLDKVFETDANFFFSGMKGLKDSLNNEGDGGFFSNSSMQKFASLGGLLSGMSKDTLEAEGNFDALGQQLAGLGAQDLPAAQKGFAGIVRQYDLTAEQTRNLLRLMPAYRDSLAEMAGKAGVAASDHNLLQIAQGKGAVSTKVLAYAQAEASRSAAAQAAGIAQLAGSATDAKVDIEQLATAIAGFGSVTLDARGAQRDFAQAVDDAREAAKKSGNVLSDSTQADRDKQQALDDVAQKALAVAAAFSKQPDGVEKATDALRDGRKEFIDIATEMTGSAKKARQLADDLGLIPENVSTAYALSGTDTATTEVQNLLSLLGGIPRYMRTQVSIDALEGSGFNGSGPLLTRAGGGPVNGPGPKGKDSIRAVLAPGEHVLTAAEVDRMGGQSAVTAFRHELMAFAKGGPVNSISAQAKAADRADEDAKRYAAAVRAARSAETRAQKDYDAIDGTKDNRSAKRAAKARLDAASDNLDALEKKLDKARQDREDATSAAAALRQDREDFVSAERRDPTRATSDPLTFVDQLRSMSRDDNYSAAQRGKFKDAANDVERSLARLTERADAAATELKTLQDASKQMHDSIAQSIAGGYTLGGAATRQTTSGWFERDGVRYQSTSGGPSASSIAGYYAAGAASAKEFADTLSQLAGRGLNSKLLAELAGMGTEAGLPIAKAILAGSGEDLQSINAGYSAIASAADLAGTTVADANYAKQIEAADRNAATITEQIRTDGEKLRGIIAKAFGLKGYASGTASAEAGIRWVGEQGPELAGFGGGEAILNAAASKRWVASAAGFGGSSSGGDRRVVVEFPESIALHDADGAFRGMVRTEARGVAQQEIDADAKAHAVHLMFGGAA